MQCKSAILTCCLVFALATPLKASPYCDINLSTWDGEARWGVWRVVDVGPDDYNYMGDGDDVEFKTYWFVGFGRYLIIQVSQGTVLCLISLTLLAIGVILHFRRRGKPGMTFSDYLWFAIGVPVGLFLAPMLARTWIDSTVRLAVCLMAGGFLTGMLSFEVSVLVRTLIDSLRQRIRRPLQE